MFTGVFETSSAVKKRKLHFDLVVPTPPPRPCAAVETVLQPSVWMSNRGHLNSSRDGFLSREMEICSQQLRTLNVIPFIELLIDRMGGIGRTAHGQKQDILASCLLKS
jgi:hypothetical protein